MQGEGYTGGSSTTLRAWVSGQCRVRDILVDPVHDTGEVTYLCTCKLTSFVPRPSTSFSSPTVHSRAWERGYKLATLSGYQLHDLHASENIVIKGDWIET